MEPHKRGGQGPIWAAAPYKKKKKAQIKKLKYKNVIIKYDNEDSDHNENLYGSIWTSLQ
jgi:hypothetical protein